MRRGASTRWEQASRGAREATTRRGRSSPAKSVHRYSSEQPPLSEYPCEQVGYKDGYGEHQQPDRRRIPEVEKAEGALIEPERYDLGGLRRSAVGRLPDDVEVAQRIHRADQERHDDDARDRWQHDVPEPLQVARPIYLGGLKYLRLDGHQAGKCDQGDERCPLPHVHQNDRNERRYRTSQNVSAVDTALPQHPGVEAVGRVYQEPPEKPHDHGGYEHRDQDQRAPGSSPRQPRGSLGLPPGRGLSRDPLWR